MNLEKLSVVDPELKGYIDAELNRQRDKIELIASENIVTPAVMEAMGSVLTNKYAEGYPGHRYYGGCEYVDKVETLAIERAKKLFHAEYANVQAHCGASTNLTVYHHGYGPVPRWSSEPWIPGKYFRYLFQCCALWR